MRGSWRRRWSVGNRRIPPQPRWRKLQVRAHNRSQNPVINSSIEGEHKKETPGPPQTAEPEVNPFTLIPARRSHVSP